MKCDEYEIQRPNNYLKTQQTPTEMNGQQLHKQLVKRKCIENDANKSNQIAVISKSSTRNISKSMTKIGSEISIQKVALANVATPSTNAPMTPTAANKRIKIKKVTSLCQPANNSSSNDDQQKKTHINNENGCAASSAQTFRIVPVSKTPGRNLKVLIRKTGQVNAQSMSTKFVQITSFALRRKNQQKYNHNLWIR